MSDEKVEKDWTEDPVGNYAKVAAERGISDESMADHLDTVDPALAAKYRAQVLGQDGETKRSAPKGRRTAAKSEA